ncbi:acetylglutamate kinase [Coraliomargarita parva]|uniref:acetylglutamate kinase n=1 Tax=Coraliomargarita parva TaxID=3014050 RepID=UPI0022B4D48E|nr:acetylglutamate kinase [Coraliomargarita parva]
MMPLTDHLDVTTKAAVLLEALPYVQRFRDCIFVIKYGGAFMDAADPEVRTRVATDIAFLHAVGIKVVVVHGGGKAITRALAEAEVETRFEHGLRVTDAASVNIVEHTLNKVVNLEICEILQAKSARPLGLPGNGILVCDKKQVEIDGEAVDIGYVGETHTVKTKIIRKALNDGYIPVISPIACDEDGQIYNTNADAAAGRVAAALRARRLVYLCDVPGLMHDIQDPSTLISSLKINEIDGLVQDGTISKGMIPKTDSAVKALLSGVHRVHFVDAEQPHSLLLEIFTDKGVGTEIVNA